MLHSWRWCWSDDILHVLRSLERDAGSVWVVCVTQHFVFPAVLGNSRAEICVCPFGAPTCVPVRLVSGRASPHLIAWVCLWTEQAPVMEEGVRHPGWVRSVRGVTIGSRFTASYCKPRLEICRMALRRGGVDMGAGTVGWLPRVLRAVMGLCQAASAGALRGLRGALPVS